jgi:hypothetical protein
MKIPRKIRVYIEIPISPINMEATVTHAMTMMNISLSGCFIKMDQALEVGMPLSFSLPLRNEKMLKLRGTIAREQDDPHGYGIRFEALTDELRSELALLIADSEDI